MQHIAQNMLYKQIASTCAITQTQPPATAPGTTAPPNTNLTYSIIAKKDTHNTNSYALKIAAPDGTDALYPAPMAINSPTIQSFFADFDTEHETELPLLSFTKASPLLNKTMAPFLVSYMSDAHYLDKLPALSIHELLAVSNIETYLGAEHSQFWQRYGFSDANIAWQTLETALAYHNGITTKASDEALASQTLNLGTGLPLNFALADILKEAFTFEASTSTQQHLLTSHVEPETSELIPFVYAALRKHVKIGQNMPGLSDEKTIFDQKSLSEAQKKHHFFGYIKPSNYS